MDTERRELLTAALTGYRTTRDQISHKIGEIEHELRGARAVMAPVKKGTHRISAEGRKRIAEAQRKRWAAHKTAA
jgi:hypothetical protein